MSIINVEVEVDLDEYYDECLETVRQTDIYADICEFVKELEKELYFYNTKNMTLEDIYKKLKEMVA